ncbi:MAG: AI-2E family transporter [Patescibacteria group bacterium]
MNKQVAINFKTIVLTILFLLFLGFLALIIDLLLILFVAYILFATLNPLIEWLQRRGIIRPVAVLLTVLSIFLVLGLLFFAGVAPIAGQFNVLVERITKVVGDLRIFDFFNLEIIERELREASGELVNFFLNILGNVVIIVSVIAFTIYFLLARKKYESLVESLSQDRKEVRDTIYKIERKLGAWLRGQFLLSLVIGILYFIVLTILDVGLSLPLAIIGALLEIIPIIGPILAWIPAVLVALTISPLTALLVTIAYIVIQQIESEAISPIMLGRVVSLDPILILIAVSIGQRLLGFAGILLAVPVTVVIQIIITEILARRGGDFLSLFKNNHK